MTRYESWQSERGFTLIEMLIIIAVMMIVLTVASSTWFDAVESRRVDSATNQMVSELRRAHTNATNRLESWQVDPRPAGKPINSYRVGLCADPCGGATLSTPLLYLDECREGEGCSPTTRFPSAMSGVRVVFHSNGSAQFFGAAGNIIQVAAADGSPCRQIEVNTVTSRVEVLPNACP